VTERERQSCRGFRDGGRGIRLEILAPEGWPGLRRQATSPTVWHVGHSASMWRPMGNMQAIGVLAARDRAHMNSPVCVCSGHRVRCAANMTPVRIPPMSCAGDLVSFVLRRAGPRKWEVAANGSAVGRHGLPNLTNSESENQDRANVTAISLQRPAPSSEAALRAFRAGRARTGDKCKTEWSPHVQARSAAVWLA